MCFFQMSRPLTLFFLGPTAYTCSHIDHMRKVFLHFGFACVIWVTEPVCRKCYIGYKNKAFRHCALASVFGDSKLEWKNICIGRMKRASRTDCMRKGFIFVDHLVCFECLSRCGGVIALVAAWGLSSLCVSFCLFFWEPELVSKNIHTGHKQKAFCHCALVCAFWDGDALW